jgi:hypothetical protein
MAQSYFPQQLPRPKPDITVQNRISILRHPNNVIFAIPDRMTARFRRVHHRMLCIPSPKGEGFTDPRKGTLNVMPDGSFRLDVRASLKTDDGEFILIAYNGILAPTKDVMDRFNKGEVIASNDVYFLTAPRFTTASKKYDWLNTVQAVGKMVTLQQGKLKYDLFLLR